MWLFFFLLQTLVHMNSYLCVYMYVWKNVMKNKSKWQILQTFIKSRLCMRNKLIVNLLSKTQIIYIKTKNIFLIKENKILLQVLLFWIVFIGIHLTLASSMLFTLPHGNLKNIYVLGLWNLADKCITSHIIIAVWAWVFYVLHFPRILYTIVLVWPFPKVYNN